MSGVRKTTYQKKNSFKPKPDLQCEFADGFQLDDHGNCPECGTGGKAFTSKSGKLFHKCEECKLIGEVPVDEADAEPSHNDTAPTTTNHKHVYMSSLPQARRTVSNNPRPTAKTAKRVENVLDSKGGDKSSSDVLGSDVSEAVRLLTLSMNSNTAALRQLQDTMKYFAYAVDHMTTVFGVEKEEKKDDEDDITMTVKLEEQYYANQQFPDPFGKQ